MQNLEKKIVQPETFLIIILIILSSYLFVFKLGGPSLWETDEPIYGEVAKEILKTGDWINLHFNYKVWLDKPPLYMWFTAFFYRLFGASEFTTRITSALFGIGQVIVVYLFGRILFSKRAGFFCAIVLATSLQFIIQSRLALLDVPLSFFISLSILFFYLGLINPDKSRYYIFSSVCMGLATLTKGPIGVLIPALIIGIYLVSTKNLARLKEIRLLRAALVFLLVASPWYIAEWAQHGWVFIDKFFLLRMASRYTTPFGEHAGPVYYYVGVLFLGFFPWSSFLPLSFFHLLKKDKIRQVGEREKSLLVSIWFATVFVFFSGAKSKLPGYIFPLYPACALGVGKLWNDFAGSENSLSKKSLYASFALFFILLTVLAFALLFVAKNSFQVEYNLFRKPIFAIIMGFLVGGVVCFMFAVFKKNVVLSVAGFVGAVCFLVWVLTVCILPLTRIFRPTKSFAKKVTSCIQPGQKIGNYPVSEDNFMSFNCTLVYYTDRPVVGIENREHLKVFFNSRERVYCVMGEENYRKIKEEFLNTPVYILEKGGGKVLVSNQQNNEQNK